MNILSLILNSYIIFLIVIFLSYLIGFLTKRYLFGKHYLEHTYKHIFLNLLIGITVLICLFSFYKTSFRTINIGFAVFGLILFWEHRNKMSDEKQLSYSLNYSKIGRKLITLLPIQILFFSLGVYSCIDFNANYPFVSPHRDYVLYCTIAESLAKTGFENVYMAEKFLEPVKYNFCSQYHYYDMWLNALISEISNQNYYLTYFLIVYPLLKLITIIGIISLWECFILPNAIHIVLSIIIFQVGQIYFPIYKSIHYLNNEIYNFHTIGRIPDDGFYKIIPYYPFMILIILNFLKRNYFYACIIVLMLPFVYSLTLPIIGGLLIILFCIPIFNYYSFDLRWPLKERKKILIYIIISIGLYFGFYKIFQVKSSIYDTLLWDISLFDYESFIIRRNIAVLTTFQTIMLYLPIVIIYTYFYFKSRNKRTFFSLIFLIALVYLMGLIGWLIFYKNPNSVQVLGNNLSILNVLLIAIFIVYFIECFPDKASLNNYKVIFTTKGFLFLLIIILLGWNWSSTSIKKTRILRTNSEYSEDYMLKVSKINIPKNFNPIGISIIHQNDYGDLSDTFSPIKGKSLFLTYHSEFFHVISLSVFDIPKKGKEGSLTREVEEKLSSSLFFYSFVEEQKAKQKFLNIEQSQLDFIIKYKVDYLIASKNAKISSLINPLIRSEIIDYQRSGERFYLLDRSKLQF